MTSRKALLLGVPSYTSENIDDLPRVLNDVRALEETLKLSDYDVRVINGENEKTTTRTALLVEISQFLKKCDTNDLAIIYLSGHGIHIDGTNYLVPSDASTDEPEIINELLVDISLGNPVKYCQASTLVVFIDACREGATLIPPNLTKSVSLAGWGTGTRSLAKDKQNIFIFSCGPGQFSQFEKDENGLSIFTRALVNILSLKHSAQTLGQVLDALQKETDRICQIEKKSFQQVKIVGEFPSSLSDLNQQVCFGTTNDVRVEKVDELYIRIQKSPLWSSAVEGAPILLEKIKKEVDEIIYCCSSIKSSRTDMEFSNFYDNKFYFRCIDRLELLLIDPKNKLSPLELAVIFSAIALAELHYWNYSSALKRNLNHITYISKIKVFERYQAYCQAFLNPEGLEDLIKDYSFEWAYFNDVNLHFDNYFQLMTGDQKITLDKKIAELDFFREIGPNCLQNLASCFIISEGIDLLPSRSIIRDGHHDEQTLRFDTIGQIAYISGRLAIHIGSFENSFGAMITTNDSIDPNLIFSTLNNIVWTSVGDKRSLRANCAHPMLDELIEKNIQAINNFIQNFHRSTPEGEIGFGEIVKGFRAVDSANLTATLINGKPAYLKPHVKIRLEDNKMRDLLMGEQLYGDPNLALRELYQNAHDACKIREARVNFTQIKNQIKINWEPKISIRLSNDELGRTFIECEDNGAGMDLDLMTNCFTFAGRKLTDTVQFAEEQEKWRSVTPEIQAHLISRFGIGVLSYFMLSNEIHVYTRHFNSSGNLGDAFKMTLYISSNIVSISNSDEVISGGTIVRLMLRPIVISKLCNKPGFERKLNSNILENIFNKFLGSNYFPLELRADEVIIRRVAGSLNLKQKNRQQKSQPIPRKREIYKTGNELVKVSENGFSYELNTDNKPFRSQKGDVWFHETEDGFVLADGMLTDKTLHYLTINLIGSEAPKLSVDRLHTQNFNKSVIEKKLRNSIRDVLDAEWITADWIWRFSEAWPDAADQLYDVISTEFSERAFPLRMQSGDNDNVLHIRLGKCGLFPKDRELIAVLEGGIPESFSLSTALTSARLGVLKANIEDRTYTVTANNLNPIFQKSGWRYKFWRDILSQALSENCNGKKPWVVGKISSLVLIRLAVSNNISLNELVSEVNSIQNLTGAFISDEAAAYLRALELTSIIKKYIVTYVKPNWRSIKVNRLKLMQISSVMENTTKTILGALQKLEPSGVISFSNEVLLAEEIFFSEKDIIVFDAITLGLNLEDISEGNIFKYLRFDVKCIASASGKAKISIAETLNSCKKIARFYNVDFENNFSHLNEIIAPRLTQFLISRRPDNEKDILQTDFSASHILRFCAQHLISPKEFIEKFSFLFQEVGAQNILEVVKQTTFDPLSIVDRTLVSLKLDGGNPWISGKIPIAHIIRASNKLNVSISDVFAKIRSWEDILRISLPEINFNKLNFVADDLAGKILSRNLNGSHPWISLDILIKELPIRAFLLDASYGEVKDSLAPYISDIKISCDEYIGLEECSPSILRALKQFSMDRMRSGNPDLFPIDISPYELLKVNLITKNNIELIIGIINSMPSFFTIDSNKTSEWDLSNFPDGLDRDILKVYVGLEKSGNREKQIKTGQKILDISIQWSISPLEVVERIKSLQKKGILIEEELPDVSNLGNPIDGSEVTLLSPKNNWLYGKVYTGHIISVSWHLRFPIGRCIDIINKYSQILNIFFDKEVDYLNMAKIANLSDVYLFSKEFDGNPPWRSYIDDSEITLAAMVFDIPQKELRHSLDQLFK